MKKEGRSKNDEGKRKWGDRKKEEERGEKKKDKG